jgi:Protein of unknown function (DUF2442)
VGRDVGIDCIGRGGTSEAGRGQVSAWRREYTRIWVDELPEARGVLVTKKTLIVALADGRRLSVPLDWFPILRDASRESRRRWELVGNGLGIHWEDLGLDLFILDLRVPPGTRRERPRPY